MIKSARWDRLKSQWAVLSFYTLALGIVYWLMRERDDRLTRASKGNPK